MNNLTQMDNQLHKITYLKNIVISGIRHVYLGTSNLSPDKPTPELYKIIHGLIKPHQKLVMRALNNSSKLVLTAMKSGHHCVRTNQHFLNVLSSNLFNSIMKANDYYYQLTIKLLNSYKESA